MEKHKQLSHFSLCVLIAMPVVSMQCPCVRALLAIGHMRAEEVAGHDVLEHPRTVRENRLRVNLKQRRSAICSRTDRDRSWPSAQAVVPQRSLLCALGAQRSADNSLRRPGSFGSALTLRSQNICLQI